jgi:predicted ester cyclase
VKSSIARKRVRIRAAVLGGMSLAAVLAAAGPASASYTGGVESGTLTLRGDGAGDTLVLAPSGPETLTVDVGGDGTAEFSFDRTTFTAIDVLAGGGDDVVRMIGSFPEEQTTINGGSGADTLTGSIGDQTLIGGTGNDVVTGGDGDDTAPLGTGNDRFTWNPGDDNDTVEGESGTDELDFNGSNAAELIGVAPNGSRVRFTRNIANVVTDLGGVERIAYAALGGADVVTVEGTAGTDLDVVDADLAGFGGTGDAAIDTVVATGTDGADSFSVGESDGLVAVEGTGALVRTTGAETQDDVVVRTLGGADEITGGIGMPGPATVNVDGGDGADVTTFDGTGGDDQLPVVANGAEVSTVVTGTARLDTLAVEDLVLRGLGGADTITSVGNVAALTRLTMDGGSGADELRGGNGADLLLGGSGDDRVDGNQGLDIGFLGSGEDHFQWDPGDGNDSVEGESGTDVFDFNGSSIGELLEVSADGERVRFTRNIANIVTDLGGVESLALRPVGGADTVAVNDLAGTDLEIAGVDLSAVAGGGDGEADTVDVRGTAAPDVVRAEKSGAQVRTRGLAAQTRITGSEVARDTLRLTTLAGDDRVTVDDVFDLIIPVVDLGADS